jgi:hypothetical protein
MREREEGEPRYRVHASAVMLKVLRQIQRRADREGRGDKALSALRHIHQRLQQDPTAVGEPLYRLPGLRMQVRTVVVRPLVIDFAVAEDRPLVFIKSGTLLSE